MKFGRVCCAVCLAARAAYNAGKRKAKDKTLCAYGGCLEQPVKDRTLCASHLEAMKQAQVIRRQRQIERGWCINSCGRRVELPPRRYCLTCNAGDRIKRNVDPLPTYVRTQIRAGLKLYRFQEAQKFLRSYLRLVGEPEQKVISLVYGLDDGVRRNLTDTGKVMGFSRERARQLHDKGMVRIFTIPVEPPVYLLPIREKMQKYPERLHQRMRARQITSNEIHAGRLVRQPCEECGAAKADAHHTDYSKPLDVQWLCPPCHKKAHRDEKAA